MLGLVEEFAVKKDYDIISVFLEGRYINSDNEFKFELCESPTKRLINIYDGAGLVASGFVKLGVGSDSLHYFGNFKLIIDFNSCIEEYKFGKLSRNKKALKEEKISSEGLLRTFSSDIFKVTFVNKTMKSIFVRKDNILIESFNSRYLNKSDAIIPISGLSYKEETMVDVSKFKSVNIRSLEEVALEKDLSWLSSKEYSIIDDEKTLLEVKEELLRFPDPIAFDTEGTGLKMNFIKQDKLTGLIFSWKKDQGVYIPVGQLFMKNLDINFVIESMRPILEKKHLVTHFGSYDWKVMYMYGIDLNICDDTYILIYLIDVNESKNSKKLKELTKRILGVDQIELEDLFPRKGKKKSYINFSLLPYDCVKAYGPADGDFTRQLYYELRPKLVNLDFIYAVELKLLKKIAKTEYYGVRIDYSKLEDLEKKYLSEYRDLENKIYKLAKKEFDINSSKQLGDVLYNELGYPILGYTSKGLPSTDKHVLNQLNEYEDQDGSKKYPAALLVKKYKEAGKVISSYVNRINNDVVEYNGDYFIFPKYNQAGADSGRITGNNPNLQQMPPEIRSLFIPMKGYYMIDVDYSQIEYRVMAALASEEWVIKEFEDPYSDFHTLMTSRMLGIDPGLVTKEQRQEGKILNFAVPYGMGDFKLALSLFKNTKQESVAEASRKRIEYLDSIPKIRDMFTDIKDLASIQGYVETFFHRKRYIRDINSDNPKLADHARRKAGNTRIQGTAADILKIAYNRLGDTIDKYNLDWMILGSIHDELLNQVSLSINPWKAIKIIRECMELKIAKFPPLYVTPAVVQNWKQGKEDDHEIPVGLSDLRFREMEKGMHMQPVEDPYTYMLKEIRNYNKSVVKKYFDEELGLSSVSEINVSKVMDSIKDYKIKGLILKALKGSKEENLKKLFEELYSGSNIIMSKVNVEEDDSSVDIPIEEILDEEILDEEDEDFGKEKVFINYSKVDYFEDPSKLEIKSKSSFVSAKSYIEKTSDNVKMYDAKYFITIDGISINNLERLKKYLQGCRKESGNKVILVFGEKAIETNIAVGGIDLDFINRLILNVD